MLYPVQVTGGQPRVKEYFPLILCWTTTTSKGLLGYVPAISLTLNGVAYVRLLGPGIRTWFGLLWPILPRLICLPNHTPSPNAPSLPSYHPLVLTVPACLSRYKLIGARSTFNLWEQVQSSAVVSSTPEVTRTCFVAHLWHSSRSLCWLISETGLHSRCDSNALSCAKKCLVSDPNIRISYFFPQ